VAGFSNKEPWGSEVNACPVKQTGGGCGDGQACAPKAPDGSAQSACFKLTGAKQCPAGFSTVINAFTSGTDSRGCSDCSCSDPATACSGGAYTFYDLSDCTSVNADPPINVASNNCTNVSSLLDQSSWSVAYKAPTASGKCQASGGQPTGEMKTDGPVTFCCQ
jgi:hypothetical protein